jgi:hypothetical protein
LKAPNGLANSFGGTSKEQQTDFTLPSLKIQPSILKTRHFAMFACTLQPTPARKPYILALNGGFIVGHSLSSE